MFHAARCQNQSRHNRNVAPRLLGWGGLVTLFLVACNDNPTTSDDLVRGDIGPNGGVLVLDSVAQVQFPAGFFSNRQRVQILRTEDAAVAEEFAPQAALFRVDTKVSYQVRVLLGRTLPQDADFTVVLTVPASLSVAPDYRPEMFVQVYADGGMEVLDHFDLVESAYDATERTLTATLPAYVFTNTRRADGLYEMIVTVATTPGGALPTLSRAVAAAADPKDCKAAFISCPLAGGCENVSDPFGDRIHPITKRRKPHKGIDFRVPNETPVFAAREGTIELPGVDPKGYGNWVIVRHKDNSATVYGHLHEVKVAAGKPVTRGELIALSNNSGGSTGPHLHFEYLPNGAVTRDKPRIDPLPCLQEPTVEGSITVRDNGTAADDAFLMKLDGVELGTTAIGGRNNFAINNLRPGNHTLSITGVVVPDNLGTYEIILNDGITFSGGGTRVSSTLTLNQTVPYPIVVPSAPRETGSPSFQMRPNTAREGP